MWSPNSARPLSRAVLINTHQEHAVPTIKQHGHLEVTMWVYIPTPVCSLAELSGILYTSGALTWLVTKQGSKETTCGQRTMCQGAENSLSPQLLYGNHQYQCQDLQIFGQTGWPSWRIPGCMFSSPGLIRVGKPSQHPYNYLATAGDGLVGADLVDALIALKAGGAMVTVVSYIAWGQM